MVYQTDHPLQLKQSSVKAEEEALAMYETRTGPLPRDAAQKHKLVMSTTKATLMSKEIADQKIQKRREDPFEKNRNMFKMSKFRGVKGVVNTKRAPFENKAQYHSRDSQNRHEQGCLSENERRSVSQQLAHKKSVRRQPIPDGPEGRAVEGNQNNDQQGQNYQENQYQPNGNQNQPNPYNNDYPQPEYSENGPKLPALNQTQPVSVTNSNRQETNNRNNASRNMNGAQGSKNQFNNRYSQRNGNNNCCHGC